MCYEKNIEHITAGAFYLLCNVRIFIIQRSRGKKLRWAMFSYKKIKGLETKIKLKLTLEGKRINLK